MTCYGEDLLAPLYLQAGGPLPVSCPTTDYSIYSQLPSMSGDRLHLQPEDAPCHGEAKNMSVDLNEILGSPCVTYFSLTRDKRT